MTLIEMRLREVVDHDLLVVQTDGKAFKGRLVEFDNNFILLHNCLETTTKDVKWKNVVVPTPSSTGEKAATGTEKSGLSFGEKEKKVAKLNKVMINLSQVMRIWLWDPEEFTPKEFEDTDVIAF